MAHRRLAHLLKPAIGSYRTKGNGDQDLGCGSTASIQMEVITPAATLQQVTRTGGDHERALQDLQLERRRRRILSILCVRRRQRQPPRPAGSADARVVGSLQPWQLSTSLPPKQPRV